MARKVNKRKGNNPIPTIIGAGITEQYYFKHLREILHCKVTVKPHYFGQEDMFSLEKGIEQALKEERIAIVVFDADVSSWNDSEKKRLKSLKDKYANNANVVLCDTMPSIEYWFLLHYINTNRYFGTSKSVIAELIKFINDFDKSSLFLRNHKWVEDMCADGKLEKACVRAKNFGTDGESYSNVWKVIKMLK